MITPAHREREGPTSKLGLQRVRERKELELQKFCVSNFERFGAGQPTRSDLLEADNAILDLNGLCIELSSQNYVINQSIVV